MEQYNGSRHPETAALLDCLDGAMQDELQRHLAFCPVCREALEQLQQTRDALRALPDHAPPAGSWQAISDRLEAESVRPHAPRRWNLWRLSVAASVLLAVGLALHLLRPMEVVDRNELHALLDESRQLESAVQYLGDRPVPMDLRTAGRIARLQENIALVDMALNETRGSTRDQALRKKLLQERVSIMRDLLTAQARPMLASYQAF